MFLNNKNYLRLAVAWTGIAANLLILLTNDQDVMLRKIQHI